MHSHDYYHEKFKSPEIQSIINFWTDQIGKPVNLSAAKIAAASIYAQFDLEMPSVYYWKSPIAMVLTADTYKHGYNWVKRNYGDEIMYNSVEYQEWLLNLSDFPTKKDKAYRSSRLMSSVNTLRENWIPTLNQDTLRWVHGMLTEYYPRFFSSTCDSVNFHALNGALEYSEKLYSKNILSGLNLKCSTFNSPEQCLYYAKQDIVAYITNSKVPESPEAGFRLLAKSCHEAILFEHECWVCASAKIIKRDEDDEVDCRTGPAIKFVDGSELYAINGFPVPESYITDPDEMKLEAMPYNCSMRKAFLECFGVKRFLLESNSVCVEQCVGKRLWNLAPDIYDQVRSILEVDGSVVECYEGVGIHYYESFKQVKTFTEFEESLDKDSSFTITNQLT